MVVGPVRQLYLQQARGVLDPHGVQEAKAGVQVATDVRCAQGQQLVHVPRGDDGAARVVAVKQHHVPLGSRPCNGTELLQAGSSSLLFLLTAFTHVCVCCCFEVVAWS